jgi:predicted TPR repeat methyltransferase
MDIDKVSRWYNENVDLEENRLRLGRLEYEVMLHYIRNAIFSLQKGVDSEARVRIADVGCGTGVYGTYIVPPRETYNN